MARESGWGGASIGMLLPSGCSIGGEANRPNDHRDVFASRRARVPSGAVRNRWFQSDKRMISRPLRHHGPEPRRSPAGLRLPSGLGQRGGCAAHCSPRHRPRTATSSDAPPRPASKAPRPRAPEQQGTFRAEASGHDGTQGRTPSDRLHAARPDPVPGERKGGGPAPTVQASGATASDLVRAEDLNGHAVA